MQQQNRALFLVIGLVFCISSIHISAQTDSLSIEKMRAESGVDPTRVTSKVGCIAAYFDRSNNCSYYNIKIDKKRKEIKLHPSTLLIMQANV